MRQLADPSLSFHAIFPQESVLHHARDPVTLTYRGYFTPVIWMNVNDLKLACQLQENHFHQIEGKGLENMFQPMKLNADDPKPPKQLVGRRGKHKPFSALNVHLQQQVAFDLLLSNPIGQRDEVAFRSRAKELAFEFDQRVRLNRRSLD